MSDLILTARDFKASAARLNVKYEDLSVNELADKFCQAMDNNDKTNKDVYFSALMLRFWYKIGRLYNKNDTLNLNKDDYYSWLVDSLLMACAPDNRAWQKDPTLNAQQVVFKILATRFEAQAYYEANLQKNLGKNNCASLDDTFQSDEGDATLGDVVEDPKGSELAANSTALSIIQSYLNRNKITEAIILDVIAFRNVFRTTKKIVKTDTTKYTEFSTSLWRHELVQEISTLDDTYITYFTKNYKVDMDAFKAALSNLSKANNTKRYKMIDKTLDYCRKTLSI